MSAIQNGINERAVRELFEDLKGCWARGDADAYGALFTADADYVAFDGSRSRGPEEIAAAHRPLFEKWLKGSRLTGGIDSIRFVTTEVALVHSVGAVLLPGRQTPHPSRLSHRTLIAARQSDGQWLLTAFHNSRIQRRNWLQRQLFAIATIFFRR